MKKNNKGFTLAELLIVVAIIAVLVAIAIPVFTSQLERSRESTDVANLRAAYAAGQTAALTGWVGQTELTSTDRASSNWYYNPGVDGSLSKSKPSTLKMGQGTSTDGKFDKSALPSVCTYETNTDVKGKVIKVTITSGVVSAVTYE
jgi:type IV pilus assembly protein PilA